MTLNESSQSASQQSGEIRISIQDIYPPVKLEIKGMIIPSFKNRKIICGNRLITNPKQKKLMQQIIQSFALQLCSAFPTTLGATRMDASRRFSIVSSMPADDCWTRIPDTVIHCEKCEPGQEGCTVVIERIS